MNKENLSDKLMMLILDWTILMQGIIIQMSVNLSVKTQCFGIWAKNH